jgi:hypothetical protein
MKFLVNSGVVFWQQPPSSKWVSCCKGIWSMLVEILKEALKHNATIHSWSLGFTPPPFFFFCQNFAIFSNIFGNFFQCKSAVFLAKISKMKKYK